MSQRKEVKTFPKKMIKLRETKSISDEIILYENVSICNLSPLHITSKIEKQIKVLKMTLKETNFSLKLALFIHG